MMLAFFFWYFAPCSLVVNRCSEVLTSSINIITLIMEAVDASKSSVNFYETTLCYSPEAGSIKYSFDLFLSFRNILTLYSFKGYSLILFISYIIKLHLRLT